MVTGGESEEMKRSSLDCEVRPCWSPAVRPASAGQLPPPSVPVLFGSGTRMFDHLSDAHIQLEPIEVIQTPQATHLRCRIVK
jgi:hypothetical protein